VKSTATWYGRCNSEDHVELQIQKSGDRRRRRRRSAFAFALAQAGIAEEIALIDVNADLAKGQALDLAHGAPFYRPVDIQAAAGPDAYRDAAIVVVTAGKAQAGPNQSRLDLMQINAKIVSGIVAEVQAVNPEAIVLIATNPVDILTHVARLRTDWPRGRILGSGTVLDSARFRWLLAEHCGISPQNVHASILGEHGDSEFAAWSLVHVGGLPMDDYCSICRKCDFIHGGRKFSSRCAGTAYHSSATRFDQLRRGDGADPDRARDPAQRTARADGVRGAAGQYGLNDVTLGIPCVVGAGGIEEIIEARLTPEEMQQLAHSAQVLKDHLRQIEPGGA
jgi:L-lactate dehydrogenase